jgi:hypothetical protein
MTTSGLTSFSPVMSQVLYRSLRMVGAYASTDSPRAEQVADALDVLNMMIKTLQIEGLLWLKSFAQVTLVAGQYYYPLGPAGAAHYWPALTTLITRPTRVWGLRRLNTSGYEIPLANDGKCISRQEYEALPNKTTTGTVVQAYYDPQLVNGMLYVWPCPATGVTDKLNFTVDRTLEDMINDDVTFDFPTEWAEPLTFMLAERLWWEYPDTSSNYQLLLTRSSAAKESIMSYNRENADTFIQPG